MHSIHQRQQQSLIIPKTLYSLLLLLILMICLIVISGCTVGIKDRVHIVYVSYGQTPEELKGALRVATNKPIPVTVVGDEDTYAEIDLGGYFVVHQRDLKAFLDAVAK